MSNVNYEAMKAEYEDAIQEKLYAFYKANGIPAAEAISLRETFVNSLVKGGFVERSISEGLDKKVYRDLMDLLQGFGFDRSYSVEKKRRLLREIADSVASRLDKEKKATLPQTTVNPEEDESVRAFWNTMEERKNGNGAYYTSFRGSYYDPSARSFQLPTNEGNTELTNPNYNAEEFLNPNNNGTIKEGGRRYRKTRRRRHRRNRKSHRRH